MSVATNPNRRQALREATQDAIAQFMQNGGYVTRCETSTAKVKTFRHFASIASQGRKLTTLRNAGFASR
jgi:hypothetical protein